MSILHLIYPVRNNAPLLPPGQRPSGPAAATGLDFRIIPAGFNAPLEFLTGFTAFSLLQYSIFSASELQTIYSLIIIPQSAFCIPHLFILYLLSAINYPLFFIQHFPHFSCQSFQRKGLLDIIHPRLQNPMMGSRIVCVTRHINHLHPGEGMPFVSHYR